jgi:hypothetical protein
MPSISTSSINLSVKNASEFVNTVKSGSRILSFYLGSIDSSTTPSNSERRRNDVYKEASFFKKIEPSEVDLVAKKISFGSTAYQTWNSYTDNLNNYYVVSGNRVYLVIGNNKFNTNSGDETNIATTIPTHTSGIQKYSDGYEYLYIYTLPAENKIVSTNNLWIPVPDIKLPQYKGKLLYKKIDAKSISDVYISYNNPEIPILSDTGSGAKIRLMTQVLSSPDTTFSNRKYKVIGIEVVNIGSTEYFDFDLLTSLTNYLTRESSETINKIDNAISIGFSSNESFDIRNILQAKYSLITLVANSSDVEGVIEQKSFNSFGLVEDITDDSDVKIFDSGSATKIVSNNVKITTTSYSLGPVPTLEEFSAKTPITLQSKTRYQKGKVASQRLSGGGALIAEVEVKNKNTYEVGDTIKTAKSGNIFLVSSVTKPQTKEFSGKVLHISDANFTFDTDKAKTFVTQVIQKF